MSTPSSLPSSPTQAPETQPLNQNPGELHPGYKISGNSPTDTMDTTVSSHLSYRERWARNRLIRLSSMPSWMYRCAGPDDQLLVGRDHATSCAAARYRFPGTGSEVYSLFIRLGWHALRSGATEAILGILGLEKLLKTKWLLGLVWQVFSSTAPVQPRCHAWGEILSGQLPHFRLVLPPLVHGEAGESLRPKSLLWSTPKSETWGSDVGWMVAGR